MTERGRNTILVLAIILVPLTFMVESTAACGQRIALQAVKGGAIAEIDLTGPVQHASGPISIPGSSAGGTEGGKPLDLALPVRLNVESLENKAGRPVLKIHLFNQGERPLDIPVSLNYTASPEAQEGSTSFLFSIVLSVPGSNESFSRPLVSSSDSDPKHSRVVLPPGRGATILLPLPAYIFRAKDLRGARELTARVSVSEVKIKKQEYKVQSVRKAQSADSLTLSTEEIAAIEKGSDQ